MGINKIKSYSFDIPISVWIKLNSRPIIFGLVFLIGIFLGAMVSAQLNNMGITTLVSVTNNFIIKREEQSIYKTFISALLPNIAAWTVVLISGFSAVSVPITVLIPCIRGMGFGLLACSMIVDLSLEGVGYICLHLLPNLILSAFILALCCKDSIEMSKQFWNSMSSLTKRKVENDSITAPIFCGKMLLYAVVITFGAAIEAYSYMAK